MLGCRHCRLAADGEGYGRIVDRLNALGCKTKKGKAFAKNSIYEILKNPRYKGEFVFNRRSSASPFGKRNNHKYKDESQIIRIEDGCPAIVSKELWERANAARIKEYERQIDNAKAFLTDFETQNVRKTVTEDEIRDRLNGLHEYMLNPANIVRTKYILSQYIERIDISNETVKAVFKTAFSVEDAVFTKEVSVMRKDLAKDITPDVSDIVDRLYFAS